jgi:hypothetical protein
LQVNVCDLDASAHAHAMQEVGALTLLFPAKLCFHSVQKLIQPAAILKALSHPNIIAYAPCCSRHAKL